jgi:small subunit ribosomal protein S2
MASLVKDLIESGIHFGHKTNNWNPKMGPYIHGKKNKIHIIDVKQTIKGLLLARKFLTKIVSGGKDVLFVGTKRQARPCIEKYCKEADQPYVIERWLGGTLTNFRTIRERLKRLEELEGLEESGQLEKYSKKMESTLRREKSKILRNLEGIRNMTRIPGALVIIDVKREHNAVREARKLGIPTVCLIDTDSDPDWADIPIPGNDDAMRSIEVVINSLMAAVSEGKTARAQAAEGRDGAGSEGKAASKRKSSRPQSEGSASSADEAAPAEQAPAAAATEPVAAADGAAPAAG